MGKIITLEGVSKRYRLRQLGARSLREELTDTAVSLMSGRNRRASDDEFFALRDIDLEIQRGETIGVIGPNGSGKSTLLKLLARVVYPTRGKIVVLGSVASLIEVGAGFHPELTGRENIFLYGCIMGMRRADVRRKFDEIVEFSELQRFIDTPVKRYSSGMYVRLGFAVAAHINPEVLLVDEVLAVGDASFRSKCLQRIEELRQSGTTIIFVSHDMATVEWLCGRAFFLHEGQIRSLGAPQQVIRDYHDIVVMNKAASYASTAASGPEPGSRADQAAEIINVGFFDAGGAHGERIRTGEPLLARMEYRLHQPLEDPVFQLLFYTPEGQLYSQLSTDLSGQPIRVLRTSGVVEFSCDELVLRPGVFEVEATIARRNSLTIYHRKEHHYVLRVQPGKKVRGVVHTPQRWELRAVEGASSLAAPAAEQE